MTTPKLGKVNAFFDEWRAIVYLATALGIFSGGVIVPNLRISQLQAEQKKDRQALAETTDYLRVLATAQCLDDSRPQNKLMELLCNRVVNDKTILALPPKAED